jgi:hypothetical protein
MTKLYQAEQEEGQEQEQKHMKRHKDPHRLKVGVWED